MRSTHAVRRSASYAMAAVIGIATALVSASVPAQTYPTKPVRLIVPSAAGSPADHIARWLGERMTQQLGQPVVVENRAGAGGIIGTQAVVKSPADGYTLLYAHQGILAFNPFLYSKPGYDALRDLAPIARFLVGPLVIAVNSDSRIDSIEALLREAKAQPGKLTSATGSVGTPPHLASELFRRVAGIDVTLVPFQAGNFAVADLVAGRVSYTIDGVGIIQPHAKSGRLRMLASTGTKRMSQVPDLPTVGEAGLRDYVYETWGGLTAPAGTPPAIVARLAADVGKVMATSEGRESLLALGWEPVVGDTPESFAAFIKAEYTRWGDVIRQAGIKID